MLNFISPDTFLSHTQHCPSTPLWLKRWLFHRAVGAATLGGGHKGLGCCLIPSTSSFLSTAPAQAQIIHAGQACVVKEDNISERVYTIREGDTLVLQCLVTGHPRPQVSFQPCLSPMLPTALLCSLHRKHNCGQWGAQLSPTCWSQVGMSHSTSTSLLSYEASSLTSMENSPQSFAGAYADLLVVFSSPKN